MKNWIRVNGISKAALMDLNRMLRQNKIIVPPGKDTYDAAMGEYAFPVECGK